MSFKDVPIPALMRDLKLDKRGYPIPSIVFLDDDGHPHFTINDEKKRQQHIREDRCSICGNKLYRFRWSAGGPGAVFHENGAFIDTPMHYECVRYAMKVCPYLAVPNYNKRIEDKTLDRSKAAGQLLLVDPSMKDNRPDPFVMVKHEGQKYIMQGEWVQYIVPNRPHLGYEYWSKGVQLPDLEGWRLSQEYVRDVIGA